MAMGNIYSQAANYLQQGGSGVNNAMNVFNNVPTVAAGMNAYRNPYTQQVTNRAINDIGRTTAMQQEVNRASAANAGAFGGSRHGLVEAETNAAAQRNIGDLSANLNLQGFNTAAGLAQNDITNRMTGGANAVAGAGVLGNLATSGFNMGNTLQNQQWQQGLVAQQMQQQQLNDAQQQFYGFANSPLNYLNMMGSALSGSPLSGNTTQTSQYTPGLGDYLSFVMGLGSL